ncbi:MAG TPA: SRPBCC domain-containing protein [Flavobacteriales bacterium]
MSAKETTVERQVRIDAPVATVWKALNVRGLSTLHLLREEGTTPLKEGGRLEWHGLEDPADMAPRIKGHVTVLAPERRIAYMAFSPATGLADIPENYTSVDINFQEEEDGRTLITVVHGDFAEYPHGHRLAKQAGDSWVEALVRLKSWVELEQAA